MCSGYFAGDGADLGHFGDQHFAGNRAVVLWLDEKPQTQALDREQPSLPMAFGVTE